MFEKILVPLQLINTLNLADGKTRLQKLMFLIQRKAEDSGLTDLSYDFRLHYHGPFSFELSSIIKELVKEGFLREEMETTPSGYTKFVYTVTDKGRNILEQARRRNLLPEEIVRIGEDVAREYGQMPLPSLIDEAYRKFSQ